MPRTVQRERLLWGYTGRMFVTITVTATTVRMGRFVLPPMLPAIIDNLAISPFQAGVALTAMTAGSALLQYPGGRLSDQLSRKTVVVGSSALLLVSFVVLAGTPAYAVLLAGALLFGVGDGLFRPTVIALLSDLFVERRGQALGVHLTSTDFAGVAATAVATVVLSITVWRAAFLPLVAIMGVMIFLVHVWNRESYRLSRVRLGLRDTGLRLFENPRLRGPVAAYALLMFAVSGVVSFLPTFLRTVHGFSPDLANATFAALFAVGIVVRPIVGRISDHLPKLSIIAVTLLFSSIGITVFVTALVPAAIIAGVIVFAIGQRSFAPVMQSHLMDAFPEESKGGDFGATRTVYLAVGSLGPTYVGFVADTVGYTVAFAGSAACVLLAAAIIAWMVLAVRR